MQGRTRGWMLEALVAAAALALLAGAWLADAGWYDHHFPPEFLKTHAKQHARLDEVRLGLAAAGLLLLLVVCPRLGRLAERHGPGRMAAAGAPYLAAILLALGASEQVLQRIPWRSTQQSPPMFEPRRQWDNELGWRHVPDRTGYGHTSGRKVQYVLDPHGYRVRSRSEPVDYARPSIVFAGESIVYGHGLAYDESLPGQVAAMTGLQSADLAVGGFTADQAYLSLKDDLPKFATPRAVVILFTPALFNRMMDTDRPHVTRGLVWHGPDKVPRLVEIARRAVPYRSDREMEQAAGATRDVLRASVAMARGRGAVPLVIDPELGPESAEEAAIRRLILDGSGVPYVRIPLQPDWRLGRDRHPDARGARAMAEAVTAYLRAHGLESRR